MNKDYSVLTNHPFDYVIVFELSTHTVIHWNEVVSQFVGSKELKGTSIFELYPELEGNEEFQNIVSYLKKHSFLCFDLKVPDASVSVVAIDKNIGIIRISPVSSSASMRLQKYYQTLFEKNVSGVYRIGIDGLIRDCNSSFAKILGFQSRQEVIGLDIRDFYPDRRTRQKFVEEIKKEQQLNNYEVLLKTKNGGLVHCLENAFLDKDGHEFTINGTLIDITEEQVNKEMYAQIFVGSSDAIVIMKNEKIIDFNSKAIDLFDRSLEEWEEISDKKDIIEILVGKDNEVDYIEHKLKSIRSGLREQLQLICRRKDNTKFHSRTDIIPFRVNNENYWQIVIRDISERVLFEHTIRESEERFRVFSEAVKEGVLFLEKDKVIDVNTQTAALFEAKKSDELIGKNIQEFLGPLNSRRILSAMEGGSLQPTEILTKSLKGKPLALEVSGGSIKYKGKERLALLFYDVTQRVKTEKALEQSSQRFQNLVENSPNAVFILTDGLIKYSNGSGLELLGFSEEDELFNKEFTLFFERRESVQIEKDLEDAREGMNVEYRESAILNNNGQKIDVGIKPTLTIYDNKPSIQITVNNLSTKTLWMQERVRAKLAEEINEILKKEIEEHKVTQQKLIEAQNFARNIIDSSLDMIIAVDDQGVITEFNAAALKQFGYFPDEVLGKNAEILYESRENFSNVENLLKEHHFYSGEIRNMKKNGESFTSLLSASLIRNEKGQVLGSMGVSRDVTEIRRKNRLMLEQKAKLEAIFNSTRNMMMWTLDQDMNVTSMNENFARYIEELSREKVSLGKNYTEVITPHINEDYYQGQMTNYQEALSGKTRQFEMPLINDKGHTIWLQTFLNPIYIEEEIREISCLAYDITDRIEVDRKIRDALKEKEVLLQEVHHRVKNNLQVISSILSLQSSYVHDERTLEILSESQQRIKTMSFIHETLYRTADFSSIGFTEYISTIVINLVQSYVMTYQKVNLVTDLDDIVLSIDQAIPCGLIVNELVSNALKYAYVNRASGSLEVSVKQNKNTIQLKVKDDGEGLPKDFRYEDSDSLGIQLVYTLVEQLDATIEVKNKDGAEFLINFEKR